MKNKSLRYLYLACALLTVAISAKAQSIYTYSNATSGAYASLAANLTASTLATVGSWGSNTPCSNGGGISGITVNPSFTTFNPANASSPALNVNITPNTGYMIKVTSISVSMRRSSTGPAKARLAYSVDGGTTWFNNGTDYTPNNGSCGSFSSGSWTLGTPLYVCSGMLKVRIYYFAAGATTGTCQTANLVVSGTVTPIPVPSIAIASNAGVPICSGTNVTFTATPSNQGTAPTYTWKKNGTVVGANSNSYSDNTLTAADAITCEMNSNAPCISTAAVISNAISLPVIPVITSNTTDTVCYGESYPWGTQTLNTTGVYSQVFTSAVGCDSTVTMNFFVRPQITHAFADTVCFGDSYTWASQTLTATGSYLQTFPSYTGCDSIVTCHLFVRPEITHAFSDTACYGSTYVWQSLSLATTGTYLQTFPSYTGCDSNVTLHLFVRPAITHAFADTICAFAAYNWAGQSFTTTGTYNHTFTSYTNCDSVATLNLFVRPTITKTFADTICAFATYNWAGQAFTTTGTYNHTFTSYTNCDSIVTLNLFVRPAIINTVNATICNGSTYVFGTQVLSLAGTYNHAFQAANGCDSNVTLILNITPVITNTVSATICYGASYNWGTQVYTTSGSYTQTFVSSASCDSIVTLNLTVSPLISNTISDTICYGTTYTLGSQVLNTSGTYNATFTAASGCDSLVTLHLTISAQIIKHISAAICYAQSYVLGSQALTTSGSYTEVFTSVDGCDSTVQLVLNVSPQPPTTVTDTASCGALLFEGTLYTSSTTLTDTFHTSLGCDSLYRIVNITVHSNNPLIQTIDTVGCNSLVFEGSVYTQSTSFRDTLRNVLGCDSLVRNINITIGTNGTYELDKEICAGETFDFNGQHITTTGTYPFTFKNKAGCDSLINLNLRVNPLPNVQLAEAEALNHCIGDSVSLMESGASVFNLVTGFGEQDNGILHALLIDPENTITIEGIDVKGCKDTTSIVVKAQHCCDMWLPNAFSPNGDGLNDEFKPEAKGHPKEYVMHIFDRWGQNVYTSFNIEKGWDGTINGKPAPISTYHYFISGKCTNGTPVSLKGGITLVR